MTVYLSSLVIYLPRELFQAASEPTRHRLRADDFAKNIDFDLAQFEHAWEVALSRFLLVEDQSRPFHDLMRQT